MALRPAWIYKVPGGEPLLTWGADAVAILVLEATHLSGFLLGERFSSIAKKPILDDQVLFKNQDKLFGTRLRLVCLHGGGTNNKAHPQ